MTTVMAAPTTMPAYGTTTMAAPAYNYAQPAVTYAQAPMVETIAAPAYNYAQPAVTYAQAPMVEYAQPQYTYAQAAPVTQVASYVAQPMIAAPAAPMAPPKLTTGIPTPEQIEQQKRGYAAALDKQLKEAIETVQKETSIEKEMIKFTAEKNIALYNMQVDERLTEAMALADEQSIFGLCELKKAKVERGLQLNAQANGLVLDYQMKAVQTELAQKQYAFQQEFVKAENALAQDYNRQVVQSHTGTTYAVPASVVAQ